MNNQIEQQNLELLEQYFRDGCKWNCLQKLGVELEHFVIDRKNQKNVSYYGPDGIEELLEEWKEYYPGHERENGRLLGETTSMTQSGAPIHPSSVSFPLSQITLISGST